jgi:hypothetical protein
MQRRIRALAWTVGISFSLIVFILALGSLVRSFFKSDVTVGSWQSSPIARLSVGSSDSELFAVQHTFLLRSGMGGFEIAVHAEPSAVISGGLSWAAASRPAPKYPRVVFQQFGFGFYWLKSSTDEYDIEMVMPILVPFILSGIGPSIALRRALSRRRLRIAGAKPCPHCGYDLRASHEHCPECGLKIDGLCKTD